MVLGECPFCHKLFAAREISKEQLDSDVDPNQPAPARIAVGRRTPRGPPHGGNPGKVSLTYKLTYRCKHCGGEWTKISEEDVEIPHEYSSDGED